MLLPPPVELPPALASALDSVRMSVDGSGGYQEKVAAVAALIRAGGMPTAKPLLPLMFRWDGQPYSLDKHVQFEPMFSFSPAKVTVLQFARQLGKTLTEAAAGLTRAVTIGNYRLLYVTPLFDQARRISNESLKPLIDQSPLRPIWLGATAERSVLRRSFANGSSMQFGYAFLSADRLRGSRADDLFVDEVQDFDKRHLPVVEEILSGSKYGLRTYAGTPKTPDNTLANLFHRSSQARWCIPCLACKHLNVAAISHDLDRMIGPYRDDISAANPGTICARCARVIHPRQGKWIHRYPERAESRPGYQLPQVVAEAHYAFPSKWAELLAKREGMGQYTPVKYTNEVLGETCGEGIQLINEGELIAASTGNPNHPRDAGRNAVDLDEYDLRILSVDWGGGGETGISLTVLTVLGIRADGKIRVLWGRRLMTPYDQPLEAAECLAMYKLFRCHRVVHDYGGAGTLREVLLNQAGIPAERIVPIAYVGNMADVVKHVRPKEGHGRHYLRVSKTKALLFTCMAIRSRMLEFFAYDYRSEDDPGLIRDFLALVDKTKERDTGTPIYTIGSNASLSDDFAQAVNIGAVGAWHITKRWPNFQIPHKYLMSAKVQQQLDPNDPWDDDDLE